MSQLDAETVAVDGDTYKIFKLGPKAGASLFRDVVSILGPSLGALGDGMGNAKAKKSAGEALAEESVPELSINGGALERASVLFFQRFSEAKQNELIDKLVAVTNVVNVDGTEPKLAAIFEIHFRGRIDALYKWLFAAVKVQIGPLFESAAPAIKGAIAKLGLGQ